MFGPQALPGVLAVPSPVGATPGGHHSSQARCAIALGFTVSELSAGQVGGACFCLTLTPPRRVGGAGTSPRAAGLLSPRGELHGHHPVRSREVSLRL